MARGRHYLCVNVSCSMRGDWIATRVRISSATGRCPTAPLFAFIQNASIAVTISLNGAYNLPTDGMDNTNVVSGAFVPMICNSGFVNVGGPLNISCVAGSWTPLPNCVPVSGGGTPATTMAPMTGARCPYDSTTFALANGFLSNTTSLVLFPDTSSASGTHGFAFGTAITLYP